MTGSSRSFWVADRFPRTAPVVVIGGGFAGAATACHLARRGVKGVVVLEREPVPGAHASGRNAAILRTAVETRGLVPLAAAGARAYRDGGVDPGLLSRTGGLVLGRLDSMLRLRETCREHAIDARLVAPVGDAARLAPVLEGVDLESVLHLPDDGVVDIHGLLVAYLDQSRAAGGQNFTSCPALGIETDGEGRVAGVLTRRGRIATRIVVDAAGAWAGEVARETPASPIETFARRRHLFLTAAARGSTGPWVWSESFYLRPELGAFLVSGLDETPHAPGEPAVDPAEEERVGELLLTRIPRARELAFVRRWACLRAFAVDRLPVLGPDPALEGFFWAAGLGGIGMTASHAVGEIVSAWIVGEPVPPWARPFDPSRFVASTNPA